MAVYNRYVFPYGSINYGAKIIIYGAGKVGQCFFQELQITKFCEVIAIVDRNFKEYSVFNDEIDLISPNEINNYQYDYIIIAMLDKNIRSEIFDFLTKNLGVTGNKVVSEKYLYAMQNILTFNESFNKKKDELSLAFFVGDGLGDIIIEKKIINYVLNLVQGEFSVDLYGKEVFIKSILSDCKGIKRVLPSSQYSRNADLYDLSMNTMYILSVDRANHERMLNHNAKLSNFISHLEKQIHEYGLAGVDLPQASSIHFLRCKYLKRNAYTAYNEKGGLEIDGTDVIIPMEMDNYNKNEMLKDRYITVHSGWGGRGDTRKKHAKMWPDAYFSKLIMYIKNEFPGIVILQLGDKKDQKINCVDKYILGEDLEKVKYILKNALLHVDNESGLVHLATQLKTKCAVIFGPTPVWFFGYEQNINIVSESCNSCYFLDSDITKCIRGLNQAECMLSITPENVMQKIRPYLQQKGR